LRVAIAGLGGAALRGHLPALAQLASTHAVALVGAADPDPGLRAAAAASWPRLALFEGAEAMLGAVEADLLVVATEPGAHARLATLGLARGLHVLCEKPLTLSDEEHDAVERACLRHPERALVPVHQYRYSPTWSSISRWARRAYRWGVPFTLAIEVEREGIDPNAASPWRADVATSGGMLADHGAHFLALGWTISESIEVLAGSRSWAGAAGERSSATARLGHGLLRIGFAGDGSARRTRVELRLPSLAYRWNDETASLAIRGRPLRSWRVDALSDRDHVDALYLPLYRDLLANVTDAAWRGRRRAEALAVGAGLLALLAMAPG
jgi:predicted dehydrogenase